MRAELRYFVTCTRGLEGVLAKEIADPRIGGRDIEPQTAGVAFVGDLITGYRANLWLRSAVRVLGELSRAPARDPDQLYAWARELPWPELMRLEQTFSVTARVAESAINHSKYAALRIKDAICDVFRDRTGARPNVDVETPHLPVYLSLYRDHGILYRDFSGTTLHKRGYRSALHRAALNEATAAGILLLMEWDGTAPLIDPMCGSGTIVIEAALLALDRAPGLLRSQPFPFESWPDFQRNVWETVQSEARARARAELSAPIAGNDRHRGAATLARADAERAGVTSFIALSDADLAHWTPPFHPRVVVSNPPWGERLDQDVAQSWVDLRLFLKEHCAPSTAWFLSGNAEVTKHLGLKAAARHPIQIGRLDARLLRYEILPPRPNP
ncbi:MAG: class I SAM-dependent RNA methyltransferase [Planctomycetota bacterium]